MAWIQLTMEADEEEIDLVESSLLAAGALAVTLQDNADQPLFEPPPGETPIWRSARITGLFKGEQAIEPILAKVEAELGRPPGPYKVEALEDKDWSRAWMDSYQPMQFGRRLWICPSWLTPPDPDAVNLMLDPGLAFGTGTHPTTALCLAWLDANITPGSTVIDYGCGSGVLAIAASLLGAGKVIAVDNDPQALIATRENALRNQVEDMIEVRTPNEMLTADNDPTASIDAQAADILVANILAAPLTTLAPSFAKLVKADGQIVLSGILGGQASGIQAHYAPWFDLNDIKQQEDWVRMAGNRLPRKAVPGIAT